MGARLAGIQKAMETHSTRNLCKLEGEIRDELERVLTQEEMLWNRWQGVDRINFGERNSSIFHQKWKSENKKIMINWLQQEEGIWCSNQWMMMMMMRDKASLLRGLYQGAANDQPYNIRGLFPAISDGALCRLQNLVTYAEIRKAVFDMGPLKAPGPGGYNAHFYEKNWEVIGPQVCGMVLRC